MMQSGLSRELFEMWCTDPKNGCIVAGYCVEGTLAKHILSEPEDIQTMAGQRLKLKMDVSYISFSAHTDYKQTSGFIRALRPPHVVLVHGEGNTIHFCSIKYASGFVTILLSLNNHIIRNVFKNCS